MDEWHQMNEIKTMTTMRTTTTFFRNLASTVAFSLIALFSTAQVQQVKMNRSNPLTIQVDFQDFMFEINQASGVPLGSVQVDVEDYFTKDYSGLSGGSEFSFIYNDTYVDYGRSAGNTGTQVKIPIDIDDGDFMNEISGKSSHCIRDSKSGKVYFAARIGNEGIPLEELSKRIRLARTKDGRLAAMVTFDDPEGIFAGQYPGIKERISLMVPLQETSPAISLKLVKDKDGNLFALLLLRDGKTRVKASGSGKANLGVTVLTPSDKAIAEKIGLTLVVVN
jgi:hypothetical protein